MKQCPTCRRTYADHSQSFCLEDGTPLTTAYDAEATQVINPSSQPGVLPREPPAAPAPQSRSANPAVYVVIALLALLVGGGMVALVKSGSNNTSAAQPSATSNVSDSSAPTAAVPKKDLAAAAKPARAADESSSVKTNRLPPSGSGTWFVVLGSFPKNNYDKANQRLQLVQGLGYDASIVDTDNYPGFSSGFWSVVMGPYSRADARSVAAQVKSVRPDAYAKSGW